MFSLQVTDVFSIRGQGMVLTGVAVGGSIAAGARICLRSPRATVETVVAGIEKDRKVISFAMPGDQVAILVRGVEPEALAGGLELVEAESGVRGWKVADLRLEPAPAKWWEFWR